MDQSEVSGGWTSIYQLFWCILVFTEGTKVSKAIILFAFLGPCKYAVRWRKNRCLQRGSCKSLPRCRPVGRLAQDFQVAQFQVRASEFFGTSIALSPQLSSQLQRCYGKKDKTASRWFKQIPGILPDIEVKSWFTKRERERAQAWWEENGTKLEVDDWFMANIASISCWNNVEICWNTKRGPHHQSHQMLRDGAQELARLGAGADWQMWNSMVVAWKSFDVVWWNWWTVPLKIHEVWVLMIFDEIWCDG